MSSPFVAFANANLRFQVASGELTTDPTTGNVKPGAAVVEVRAMLKQKRDPNRQVRPGVDTSAVWVEGMVTQIGDNPENLTMPSVVTPDSPCQIIWQGRNGRFYLEFTAANPYLDALGIDSLNKVRGYFQPSSFVVEGEPWEPSPEPEPSTLNITRDLLTVSTVGQTVFSLSAIATTPQLSELYINGVKATYASEYTLNGTQLTWLMNDLQLQPEDEVEILYYYS